MLTETIPQKGMKIEKPGKPSMGTFQANIDTF
jgi:hypothetical protein